MDACARGPSAAAKIIEDGKLGKIVDERYAKWNEPKNKAMLEARRRSSRSPSASMPKASSRSRSPAGRSARSSHQFIYLRNDKGGPPMPTDIKGPAIFLAQFAGDAAPFNSWDSITKWAASLGTRACRSPAGTGRPVRPQEGRHIQDLLRRGEGRGQGQWRGDHRAFVPSAGPARRRAPGYDEAFDAFAPKEFHGKPKERQKWAVQQVKYAAKASRKPRPLMRMSPSPARSCWPFLYGWPPRRRPHREGFNELARRWKPLLDTFDENGGGLRLRAAPRRGRDGRRHLRDVPRRLDNHPRCMINYDPSHFVLQQLDYLDFIDIFMSGSAPST